ncbi:hypothetical protein [Hymenobacter antarcticus]|uniref:hypothetical protein n=1 Tax=Hymenobacter antarcticus TaxID=486270 RepID=UPI0031E86F90
MHVLDRPTALGPAEVRELEQLVQAFPYCQTAHLLLAKAAHDQGTMLAGQRLRRAATYAADRTLLRRLIEQVEPAPAAAYPEPAALAAGEPIDEPAVAYYDTETPVSPAAAAPDALSLPAPDAPAFLAPTPEFEALPIATPVVPAAVQARVVAVEPVSEVEVPAAPHAALPEPEPEATPVVMEGEAASEPQIATIPAAEIAASDATPAELATPTPIADLVPVEPEAAPLLIDREDVVIESVTSSEEVVSASIPELIASETEKILPAQAPAIRPPVEVGDARFEFGLAEPIPPALPSYELPGLIDEWAASAVTRSMGTPEALTLAIQATTAAVAVFTPNAFTGDEELGYGFGESSRLGFSLQWLNLLTDKAENADNAARQAAAAQPSASPLPPAGTFFEPDPLLCEHWAAHCPPVVALPSTVDLINNFLRRQPRLTRPAMLPPAASHQADLSVRSTRAEPDLVSENLARIFVRQGKTARAIEIYEKLIVKQPEKMAYFTAQIQQLQPSA